MDNSLEAFIDQGLSQQEQFRRLIEKNNKQVHRVFVQSEDGAELLETWKNQLLMVPTVRPGMDSFEAGINEGIKAFVRNLILQCDQFSGEQGNE